MNGGGIPPGPTKVDITDQFTFTANELIVGVEGPNLGEKISGVANRYGASDYVDISRFTRLEIDVFQENDPSSVAGGCFYNENHVPISGFCFAGESPVGNITREITVPVGAFYIRTTRYRGVGLGAFSCYGIGVIL